jgi:hypothetical protein
MSQSLEASWKAVEGGATLPEACAAAGVRGWLLSATPNSNGGTQLRRRMPLYHWPHYLGVTPRR